MKQLVLLLFSFAILGDAVDRSLEGIRETCMRH